MTEFAQNAVPDNWLYNRFGSKTGLLRYTRHETLRLMGTYNHLKPNASPPPMRLVFICMGNICRSPLGEAMARKLGVEATSYGLSTRGGDGADPRAIEFAERHQIDLNKHRTQKIEHYVPTEGDWLVCMEPLHAQQLVSRFKETPVTLLGLYAQDTRAYLHDPYNTNTAYFEHCEYIVMTATKALVQHVT